MVSEGDKMLIESHKKKKKMGLRQTEERTEVQSPTMKNGVQLEVSNLHSLPRNLVRG